MIINQIKQMVLIQIGLFQSLNLIRYVNQAILLRNVNLILSLTNITMMRLYYINLFKYIMINLFSYYSMKII